MASPERPRLFLPNFDFEAGLGAQVPNRSRETLRRNSELAFAWLAIALPGDAVLIDDQPEPAFNDALAMLGRSGVQWLHPHGLASGGRQPPDASSFDIVPWGWDRRSRDWAESVASGFEPPPLDVVTRANSREFAFECEREFGCALPGESLCRTLTEVQAAVRSLARWIIKGNLGAAGRDRLTGSGSLDERSSSWTSRRLERDGVVLVESFLDAVEEAGIQWEIPRPPRAPGLVGVVPLLSDDRGQYRGSIVTADNRVPDRWRPAVEIARLAAERIQSLGYFGPLGIDAMRYRGSDGTIHMRPLQDINARWTMGRLALGWHDRVPAGLRGVLRCESSDRVTMTPGTIRISPTTLGGRPVSKVLSLTIEPETEPRSKN